MEILIFQKKSSVETTPQNSPKKKRKVYRNLQVVTMEPDRRDLLPRRLKA